MFQRFHRFLNFPLQIKKPNELGNKDEIDLFRGYFQELDPLDKFLKVNNLKILYVDYLNTPAFLSLPIHSDFDNDLEEGVNINISFGGPNSGIRWYTYNDPKAEKIVYTTKTNIKYRQFEKKLCKEVYRTHTNKLSLVNVSPPHDTYNYHNFNRWTIRTGVAKKNSNRLLTWNEAVKIFNNYII